MVFFRNFEGIFEGERKRPLGNVFSATGFFLEDIPSTFLGYVSLVLFLIFRRSILQKIPA